VVTVVVIHVSIALSTNPLLEHHLVNHRKANDKSQRVVSGFSGPAKAIFY